MSDTGALFSHRPEDRLTGARRLRGRARRRLGAPVPGWPDASPGARNAWLLFVTTKPPVWRDPLIAWPDAPLALGEPHPGFLYPDPLGFWAEVRRWAIDLLRQEQPQWSTAEALALTTLVHLGGERAALDLAMATCRPRMVVFLDEAAWNVADIDVATTPLTVPDPHRAGVVYEGWWGTTDDGSVVGKSPQHPSMHGVYRADDLSRWLGKAPRPRAD